MTNYLKARIDKTGWGRCSPGNCARYLNLNLNEPMVYAQPRICPGDFKVQIDHLIAAR